MWLSPEQVRVLPITDELADVAAQIVRQLRDAGIRAHLDDRKETLNYRIRDAEMLKVPYMAVIGKREAESNAVAVRVRGAGEEAGDRAGGGVHRTGSGGSGGAEAGSLGTDERRRAVDQFTPLCTVGSIQSMSNPSTTPVIVAAARTPIAKFLGGLSSLSAPDLGAAAIRAALERSGVPAADVQEVIMGNVVQGGVGQAPARQAQLKAGIPAGVSALTVNKVCGSGLKAVMLAAQAIKAGDREVIVAGGQESMSNAPYYVYGMRNGVKLGDQTMVDGMIRDGLWCAACDVHMGGHAEYTARKAKITRQMQDEFAANSHRKAVAAMEAGRFKAEIVPVERARPQGPDHRRHRRGPAQGHDRGSAGQIAARVPRQERQDRRADGDRRQRVEPERRRSRAGGHVRSVRQRPRAEDHGAHQRLRHRRPCEPKELFFAPIYAVQNLMKLSGTTIGDYDLIEANEAFASQALADGAGLGWDWDRVNVNGGAIALGHPIGASGARVLTTLLYAMQDRGAHSGLATLCLGGGDAVALSVTRD